MRENISEEVRDIVGNVLDGYGSEIMAVDYNVIAGEIAYHVVELLDTLGMTNDFDEEEFPYYSGVVVYE